MDFNGMIKGEIVYGDAPTDANTMRIAFGIDANFIQPVGVAMTSILAHNDGVEFHVFCDTAPAGGHARRLAATMAGHEARCVWHVVDAAKLRELPSTFQFTTATYFRFVAAECLHNLTDRFLYVDADIICLNSLRELFSSPLTGHPVAAVKDHGVNHKHLRRIGMTSPNHFNAGVLFVDLNAWHEQRVAGQALQLLQERGAEYTYLDQDALNLVCQDNVHWLPDRYNTFRTLDDTYPPETVIVHYVGPKPWLRGFGTGHELFQQYESRSAWADTPLVTEPRDCREARNIYRVWRQRGDYAKAAAWYWRYLKWKLTGRP